MCNIVLAIVMALSMIPVAALVAFSCIADHGAASVIYICPARVVLNVHLGGMFKHGDTIKRGKFTAVADCVFKYNIRKYHRKTMDDRLGNHLFAIKMLS